ncbi:unnamed protein product, partial [Mesorhabditis spiculigera]
MLRRLLKRHAGSSTNDSTRSLVHGILPENQGKSCRLDDEDDGGKADRLLSQLLPKYVAAELKAGREVSPKSYATATVLFSDVVGFTKMCSSSTPLEVVNMLNSVYSGFDAVINKHEAYKVATIGDAYMVVSGVPEENGKRHIAHIADISLEIMQFLADYEVPHRKGQRLRCRLGFHTGSVAAGLPIRISNYKISNDKISNDKISND